MSGGKGFALLGFFLLLLLLTTSELAAARKLKVVGENAATIHEDESNLNSIVTPGTGNRNKPICAPGRYSSCISRRPPPVEKCNPYNRKIHCLP